MAEDNDDKNPRAERRGRVYDNARSKKARGEEDGGKKPEGRAEPRRADGDANGMLGRHAKEREAMRAEHEGQRRDEHTKQRDEHRAMNRRHEDAHAAVKDHAGLVALHRAHEHEKHELREDHGKRHRDMAARHHRERHEMNARHEAEMQGAAAAADPDAGAAPAVPGAAAAPQPPA